MRVIAPLFSLLLGVSTPVLADEPRTPPLKPPMMLSLPAWGEARRDCLEWRNGCQTCARDAQGLAACSTPGIACTPGEPVCVRTK